MLTEQPALAGGGGSNDRRIKFKAQIGRELLRDHAIGIMHHEGVAHLLGAVGRATVPNFAAEKDAVARFARKLRSLAPFHVVSPLFGFRPER